MMFEVWEIQNLTNLSTDQVRNKKYEKYETWWTQDQSPRQVHKWEHATHAPPPDSCVGRFQFLKRMENLVEFYVEAHHKGVLQPISFWWKYLSLKLLGSKLTFPICWKAGYKGCERVVKAGKYKNKHLKNRFYLWLLPFSKDSSSSSLLSRSLLFMKGNFLLKLIFCFALGPRLRVPVDLHKEGSLLFYESLTKPTILRIEKAWHCVFHWNPLFFDESCIFKLWMHARAWHSERSPWRHTASACDMKKKLPSGREDKTCLKSTDNQILRKRHTQTENSWQGTSFRDIYKHMANSSLYIVVVMIVISHSIFWS